MLSPLGERAIEDATRHGRAILKFISPNDAGLTGSHQCGFYLPLEAWHLYSRHAPEDGRNVTETVRITWPDGRITESAVKWYGNRTRHEYRLTRFGRDFPYLTEDHVGDLFILIPRDHDNFIAYVLDLEEDIEELQVALGVEVVMSWAVYDREAEPAPENETECVQRKFREYVQALATFPTTKEFAEKTWEVLLHCIQAFTAQSHDKQLLRARDAEYELFGLAERLLCGPEVQRQFANIDDFLETASRIMNRRKVRAGLSLEHHVERVLTNAGLPFERQPDIDGHPDIVIPSKAAYDDPTYPVERLLILGVKTTCKDRWRQVTREARRVPRKHILTLQPGISSNQIAEMRNTRVELIVPTPLHRMYPGRDRNWIVSVDKFVGEIRELFP